MEQKKRGNRKSRTGTVISDKMSKTVVVKIEAVMPHPQYGKIVTRHKKVYAHCEDPSVKNGDTVQVIETRPMSKLKRWRVVQK